MVMKVVKEDLSKILARAEITETSQALSEETKSTTFQCKISPWSTSYLCNSVYQKGREKKMKKKIYRSHPDSNSGPLDYEPDALPTLPRHQTTNPCQL